MDGNFSLGAAQKYPTVVVVSWFQKYIKIQIKTQLNCIIQLYIAGGLPGKQTYQFISEYKRIS